MKRVTVVMDMTEEYFNNLLETSGASAEAQRLDWAECVRQATEAGYNRLLQDYDLPEADLLCHSVTVTNV